MSIDNKCVAQRGEVVVQASIPVGLIPTPPTLEFACRVELTLGLRRRTPVIGGKVWGPGFQGKVLSGGVDWQTLGVAEGLAVIYARSTLQHRDGTVVSMVIDGVRRGPPDVIERLRHGEERVDPASYYFRCTVRFEVPPGPHGWLAEHAFVCAGKRWPDSIHLDVYKLL